MIYINFTFNFCRQDLMWGVIRAVVLFVALSALWLIAGAVGIWSVL